MAATGVILSAVYALTVYRRVVFGQITNNQLLTITDLETREIVIFVPLVLGTLLLGLQPNLVFNLTASSVDALTAAYHAATGH